MKKKVLLRYYRFLGRCAKRYLTRHEIFTIGINGSVGKTSCRMIIHQTLKKAFPKQKIYTSPKNFNGELGMSLSILKIENWEPKILYFLKTIYRALNYAFLKNKEYDCIILEYGIDRPLEMEFLININKPHIGVFTAIDAVHSEQFGNPAEIAREEVKMVKNTREIAFLNEDDVYAQQVKGQLNIDSFTYQTLGNKSTADIGFSVGKTKIDLKNKNIAITSLDINIKSKTYKLKTNLLGKPNFGYICVALTIAQIVAKRFTEKEFDLHSFLKEPLIYQLQPGRCSIFRGKHDSIIIDSTYNASPLSMRKLIDTAILIQRTSKSHTKLLLILGDMRELGDFTEQEHRLLAGYVQQSSDFVVLLGESMHKYLADELTKIGHSKDNIQLCYSAKEVGERVDNFLKKSNEKRIILIKGSQNTIFLEEAVKHLLSDKKDVQNLTRQSERRLKKKRL